MEVEILKEALHKINLESQQKEIQLEEPNFQLAVSETIKPTGFESYELFVFKNYIKPEHSIKCLGSSNKEYDTSPKTSNSDQGC